MSYLNAEKTNILEQNITVTDKENLSYFHIWKITKKEVIKKALKIQVWTGIKLVPL